MPRVRVSNHVQGETQKTSDNRQQRAEHRTKRGRARWRESAGLRCSILLLRACCLFVCPRSDGVQRAISQARCMDTPRSAPQSPLRKLLETAQRPLFRVSELSPQKRMQTSLQSSLCPFIIDAVCSECCWQLFRMRAKNSSSRHASRASFYTCVALSLVWLLL